MQNIRILAVAAVLLAGSACSRSSGPKSNYEIQSERMVRSEAVYLALNAEAFAHHPEQGGMTLDDLDQRMAEPWFDPAGFFVAEDHPADAAPREGAG